MIRVVIVFVVLCVGVYIEYYLWHAFVDRASVLAWTVGIALLPIVLGFVPWACITSYTRVTLGFIEMGRLRAVGSIQYLALREAISIAITSNIHGRRR